MNDHIFNNSHILAWLRYYAENTSIDLEKVKILDITRKNKNLIPAIESHEDVMVFTEAGHPDIFYRLFNAGLGECDVLYNDGSEPEGPIRQDKVVDMINRGINSSAAMVIVNPNASGKIKIGIDNQHFAIGSVRYVGSEIRAVLLSKMQVYNRKNICVISGESIAVEAAYMDGEGSIIAVEYNRRDRATMEENANQFGLNNIIIIDHVTDETMKNLPVPDVTMLVATENTEAEMECLLKLNPDMEFVIYTLDFHTAAGMEELFEKYNLGKPDITQIMVSKLTAKDTFDIQPSPWIITRVFED